MDNQAASPGVTLYVSVSHDKGAVKTSCSTHLTCGVGDDRGEMEEALAEAMAAAMAVASVATQTVAGLLTNPIDPDIMRAFVRRVNRVAGEIAEGR